MVGRPRIVVIAGDSSDFDQIRGLLDLYNYEVIQASSAIEAIAEANEQPVDVAIICSPGMEQVSRLSVQVKAASAFEDVPMVFVVHEEVDGAVMMEAQYYGALACLNFEASEYQLMAQVYNLVRIKVLQDELKKRMADLEYMASTDPLTGLYNRRFCFRRLEEELARSARSRAPLTLVYLDVDHFKAFNDTFGHACGDKVLKSVAETIQTTLRRSDVFARIGGEEFLILLPATSEDIGEIIAERLRQKVADLEVVCEDHQLHCTISCGVYACIESGGLNVDEVVHYADVALYTAKESGRNRVIVYRPGLMAV